MPTVDTGGGATVTFATLTFASYVKAINGVDVTATAVDVTDLSCVWEKFIPGDTKGITELTVDYYFDSKVQAPAAGTVDTVTVTLPEVSSAGNPATLVGSGFIIKSPITPTLANNGANMGQFTFKFDGNGTVPAFTAETDS